MPDEDLDWDEEQTIVSFSTRPLPLATDKPAQVPPVWSEDNDNTVFPIDQGNDQDNDLTRDNPGLLRAGDRHVPAVQDHRDQDDDDQDNDKTCRPKDGNGWEEVVGGEGDTIGPEGARRVTQVDSMAWVVITKTPSVRRGQIFSLDKPRMDIGRGSNVTIFLNDASVSSLHAAIRYNPGAGLTDDQFVLHDLASTNGTFLNGRRITSAASLKDGDRITIGATDLVFKKV